MIAFIKSSFCGESIALSHASIKSSIPITSLSVEEEAIAAGFVAAAGVAAACSVAAAVSVACVVAGAGAAVVDTKFQNRFMVVVLHKKALNTDGGWLSIVLVGNTYQHTVDK